jgi:VanZ family protein
MIIVLFTLGTFSISSLSNVPVAITRMWTPSDFVLHAIEYGLLAWCMLMYFHTFQFTTRRTATAYIGAFLFSGIVGGVNELWQAHVTHRGPSGSDVLANFIGAVLFIGLFHLVKMRKVMDVS